ncbi:MAG: DUF2125 domain-containing protein [Pseudooceanicola sp.]
MKRLLILILVLATGWSAYWFIGSRGAKAAFAGWFDDRRAEGWQADYADLSVIGFPSRFDTTFTNLAIADPATGWAWEAPFFQLLALSYRPTSVIAVFPPDSIIATPVEQFALTTSDTKASLSLDPSPRLPLNKVTLIGSDIALTGTGRLSLDTLRLAGERLPVSTSAYRLGALAQGVALPAPFVRKLAQGIALPPALERVELDMNVTFDRPWDLDAVEQLRPQPREIDLSLVKAEWGALRLAATGKITVDAIGQPKGSVSIKAEQWRDMLRVAVAAGALPEAVAQSVERALGLVANLSGRPDSLNVTLDFRDGRMFLGPVPIGAAPVVRLR